MPVFTVVGAYVATALGFVGTAATVVGALVAVGAAYVTSRVINGNPNKGNNSAAGSQGGRVQVPPATNNKIPVVYGNAYVNGIITDARLITTDQKINDTMFYCIVLSETCNDPSAAYSIDDIYWNDLRLVPAGNTATTAYKIAKGVKNVNNPDGVTEDFEDNNFFTDNKHLVQVRVYADGNTAADQIWPPQSTGATQNAYDFWSDDDGSWTNGFAMRGLVYAIVRVTYNGEKGFTGLPNMTFRLNNTISNPADVWYDYMTGVRYGAGINAADIDNTAKTAWKNFCDEDITYIDKDGTTQQLKTRYSINGVIDTSRPVKENIDIIMQNAGAWLSYDVSTGYWSPIIKKAVTAGEIGLSGTYFTASRSGSTLTVTNFPTGRIEAGQLLYNSAGTLIGTVTAQLTPTVGETAGQKGRYTTSTSGSITSTTFYTLPATMLAFTDDNITSGISISSTRLDDLYNSYEAEFYDKYNKDQKAYARDEILASERNPNEPDNQLRLSLDLCNNSVQADLLAKLELAQSRDDLVIEFTSTFYGIQAQAGDVISVYSELYDWAPKYFRVMRIKEQESDDGLLSAQIQALEYNPDVYTVEPLTEFTTSANIGIGVYGASPNLPQPPVVYITEIDTDVAIPNFQLQIEIPTTGGPYDEIELYYTEGWDPMSITGTVVPGTGLNGAPVGDGLLTVTAVDFGAINIGDDFTVGLTEFTITEQLSNNPVSKTYASGGLIRTNTVTLNNTTGLKIGNTLKGTGLGNFGAAITSIAGSQVTLSRPFDTQAAGTYAVFGGLGTYIVDTSATLSGTTTLFDLPVDNDYLYLKKVSPEGNNPTFTNGETITTIITEVPANSATYRRWFIKARMGIKKRFGRFSTPTTTDRNGNFRYTPNPVASGTLGDLSDVDITNAALGDFLWYNGTKWINENEPSVNVTDKTLRLTRESTSVGEDYEDEITLRLNDRVTDTNSYLNDEGGPAIRFERSSGLVYTKNWVSGGAVGAFTVTLNNSTDLAIGHLVTGTGLPATGALITNIAGPIITLNTAFTVQAAGSYSTGTPVAFGQISMEWFGTDNLHRFRVVTSTDAFDPGVGTPPPYPNSSVLIESTKNHTDINDGVLYVDAVNGRVGINKTNPTVALDVVGNAVISGDLAVNGGDITTTSSIGNLFNNTATTVNIGDGATTEVNIGSPTGGSRVQIKPATILGISTTQNVFNTVATTVNAFGAAAAVNIGADGSLTTVRGDLAVNGGDITTDDTTFNLLNTTALTVNAFGAATAVNIGSASGTTTIRNANTVVAGDLAVNGGDITTDDATFNLLNQPTTVNAFTASTATRIGALTGTTTIGYNLNLLGPILTLNSDGTVFDFAPKIVFEDDGVNPATITWNTGALPDGSDEYFSFSKPIQTVTNKNITSNGNFILDRSGGGTYTSNNAGLYVKRAGAVTPTEVSIIWNESVDRWVFAGAASIADLSTTTIKSSNTLGTVFTLSGNDVTTGGNVTVAGDVIVQGDTLTLNSNSADANPRIVFGSLDPDTSITYNHTSGRFEFASPITTLENQGIRVSQDLFGAGLHGAVIAGTTGTISTGGEFVFQRNGGTYPTNDATIRVDRAGGATDATIIWNETTDTWDLTNNVAVAADLSVGDDLTVTDDASVGGDLTVTGNITTDGTVFNRSFMQHKTIQVSAAAADSVIDSWSTNTYRTAKYNIQVALRANAVGPVYHYKTIEIVLIAKHDDTSVEMIAYGEVDTVGYNLSTFSATIAGSTVSLRATPYGSTFTIYRIDAVYMESI